MASEIKYELRIKLFGLNDHAVMLPWPHEASTMLFFTKVSDTPPPPLPQTLSGRHIDEWAAKLSPLVKKVELLALSADFGTLQRRRRDLNSPLDVKLKSSTPWKNELIAMSN